MGLLFWPRGRRALGLAGANSASAHPKTTTAWEFTDVAGRAGASTGFDCIRSSPQLAQGHRAGGEDAHKHGRQQDSFSHCSISFFRSIQVWRWGRWAVRLAIASGAKRVIAKAWPGTHNRAVAGAPAGQESYGGLSQLTGR